MDVQDVEMWVVEAISQSPPLLEASMDQFNSVVTITYVQSNILSYVILLTNYCSTWHSNWGYIFVYLYETTVCFSFCCILPSAARHYFSKMNCKNRVLRTYVTYSSISFSFSLSLSPSLSRSFSLFFFFSLSPFLSLYLYFITAISYSRCVHRSFGPDQWKGLQARLKSLRASVAVVLDSSKKYNN